MSNEPESESTLSEQVSELRELVGKQQKLLALASKHIVELQISMRKQAMSDLERRNSDLRESAKLDQPQGHVSQDDLNQLVAELQGQLEMIDERSRARTVNARAKDSERVRWLTNLDGERPQGSFSVAELRQLADEKLEDLCRFYSLLPPSEDELKQVLGPEELSEVLEKTKLSCPEMRQALFEYLGLSE